MFLLSLKWNRKESGEFMKAEGGKMAENDPRTESDSSLLLKSPAWLLYKQLLTFKCDVVLQWSDCGLCLQVGGGPKTLCLLS